MLKEEVLIMANQKNIPITDSQFRRYIQYGLIPSKKYSKGKGKGVVSIYHENTIEILSGIEDGKELGFSMKEMIIFLFSKGYSVDFEKLQQTLKLQTEIMLEKLEFLIDKTKDEDQKEWITEEIAKENLPKKIPGRPSNEKLSRLTEQKQKEKIKINSVLKLLKEIFISGTLSTDTAHSFMSDFGYSDKEPKINIPEKWFDSTNWINLISNSSLEEFEEVQRTLIYFGMYQKFLLEENVVSYFFDLYIQPLITLYQNAGLKNFLHDPLLLNLIIILLLVEPSWRKGLNSVLSLNGIIKGYETLKPALPYLLNILDEQLKGGGKENV